MRLAGSTSVLFALLGCGGSPPPPAAPVGPATWAELAPRPAESPPKLDAAKRYEVALAGPLPEVEALEAALARKGLVADVGDEADGRVVESQGVRCSVQPRPKLGEDILPSPKIEPEYARWGLTMAEAEGLAASIATAEIASRINAAMSPLATLQFAPTAMAPSMSTTVKLCARMPRPWSATSMRARRR